MFLSNNNITTLKGFAQFASLKVLSLANNAVRMRSCASDGADQRLGRARASEGLSTPERLESGQQPLDEHSQLPVARPLSVPKTQDT